MSPKDALAEGQGVENKGVAEYATERHIFIFVEMKVLKLFLTPKFMFWRVPSRALGSYAPERFHRVCCFFVPLENFSIIWRRHHYW